MRKIQRSTDSNATIAQKITSKSKRTGVFILTMLFSLLAGLKAEAQLNQGGLPVSVLQNPENNYVPVVFYKEPDWEKTSNKRDQDELAGKASPYLVAAGVATDITFPGSGIFSSANGKKIWRVQLKIDRAPAIGLYYDQFRLPKGVRYFITNGNGKQVLGAYDRTNNDPSSRFATEPLLGSVANLELDIDDGADMASIQFHIDKAAVYYRSIGYLAEYASADLEYINAIDSALTGSSSPCMINAVCPLGSNYSIQRNATFQWLIPISGGGVGACSATMVNVAGNTPSDCKQYCLLASHCEPENDTTNAAFSQVLLRYGFQQATCEVPNGTVPNTTHTLNGANFLARSVVPESANAIKGDFLLLQLKQSIPDDWRVNLAGWNNNPSIPTTVTAPLKFIGFHHPGGDVKKVSSSHLIESQALGAANSHWAVLLDSGYVAEGSSGSSLFDGTGRVIGVGSVAAPYNVPASCITVDTHGDTLDADDAIYYSKLSYDWNYTLDGTGNTHNLKTWLDPNNTGAITIDPVSSTCHTAFADTSGNGTNGISMTGNDLDNSISLYPNPSVSGKIELNVNLKKEANLTLQVMDISGNRLGTYTKNNIISGKFMLDLSPYANGVYFIRIMDGTHVITRKVMLTK